MPRVSVGSLIAACCVAVSLTGVATSTFAAAPDGVNAHAVIPGFERFHADPKADQPWQGELLLGELNCISCHTPSAALKQQLRSRQAPVLDEVGRRVRVSYLRKFLANPHETKPGTSMPDLFAMLSDEQRAQQVEALVQYLATTGTVTYQNVDPKRVAKGNTLFHQSGCVACHQPQEGQMPQLATSVPLGNLADKYTIPGLTQFLDNPFKVRPSGRMPSLNLKKEAEDVAHYLLREAGAAALAQLEPNMSYKYYEGNWSELPDFAKLQPQAAGTAPSFALAVARRNNQYGVRYQGFVHIDKPGEHRFTLTSDDGSRLLIDGKMVVDNNGIHPSQSREGKTELTAGSHEVVVEYFDGGGETSLEVRIAGPGIPDQSLAPLITITRERIKPAEETTSSENPDALILDPELAAQGKVLFHTVGCVKCHQLKGSELPKSAQPAIELTPTLANLRTSGGCLSETPQANNPTFALSQAQRSALVAGIQRLHAKTLREATPEQLVHRTMVTFNCYACHDRNQIGGVEEARDPFFVTTQQEMGDEGRIPPRLDGAGAKLTTEWLKGIFANGAEDRPYMLTRMPKFGGGNVGHLTAVLESLDHVQPAVETNFSREDRRVKADGRHIVGGKVFGCVKCHQFKGIQATGIQSIDMAIMTRRLKHDWYQQYMLNPQAYRPGTRMPAPWPNGQTFLKNMLDGDTYKQIDAVWLYLSDGPQAAVPFGLSRDAIELKAIDEPVIYRNFIQGAGARAIGVGYPEKANLAFDAENLRLALIWQGAFIDASKHWIGRGPGFQVPLGDQVMSLPPGPSFAQLETAESPWPADARNNDAYQFRGYRFDDKRRPAFKYEVGGVQVEDFPEAIATEPYPSLRRTITLKSEDSAAGLYFLAAQGASIEKQKDGYLVNQTLKLKLTSAAEPQIVKLGNTYELRVPVKFEQGQAKLVEEFVW